jgi:hypothetical protein
LKERATERGRREEEREREKRRRAPPSTTIPHFATAVSIDSDHTPPNPPLKHKVLPSTFRPRDQTASETRRFQIKIGRRVERSKS